MLNKSIRKKEAGKRAKGISGLLPLFFLLVIGLHGQTILKPIETIKVSGVAEVFFAYGEPSQMVKEISGRIVPEVIIDFKDGILQVSTKGEAQGEKVRIYISGNALKTIEVDERAQFHGQNSIAFEYLKIVSSDHGAVDLAVNSNRLHVVMEGGDITLSGTTNECFTQKNESKNWGTLDFSNLKVAQL